MTTLPRRTRGRVVLAGWLGTTIEYYDFSIYGSASSLVFARLFFPTVDPAVGTLVALSTFGVGYVARPVGAVLFGHLGDRVGRRSVLVVTLTIMGGATSAIGLLPTYASIGVAAPVLLVALRIVQGLSLGGEYSGAVLMTVEHSSEERRGLTGSLVNTGTTAGALTANLVFLAVLALPEDALLSWGWRIPFLLSAVLVAVGVGVRSTLAESPTFVGVQRSGAVHRLPVLAVLRTDWPQVLLVALGTVAAGTTFAVSTVFSLTYGRVALGLDDRAVLGVLLPAVVVVLVLVPVFGRLADRLGARTVFLLGAAGLAAAPFAWFALFDTRRYGLMLLGFAVLFVAYSANYAVFPVLFSAVFPPALRFSGMAVGFTIGTITGNAFAPAIAASLLDRTGSWVAIAGYLAAGAVVSFVAGLFLRVPDRTG